MRSASPFLSGSLPLLYPSTARYGWGMADYPHVDRKAGTRAFLMFIGFFLLFFATGFAVLANDTAAALKAIAVAVCAFCWFLAAKLI